MSPSAFLIHFFQCFALPFVFSVQLQGGKVSAVYRECKIQQSPERSSFLSVPKQEIWVDSGSPVEAVSMPVETGHHLTPFPCRSQRDYSVSPANVSGTIPKQKFLQD